MKDIVLKIQNQNWSMIGPNDLIKREWTIYNDLSLEYRETYNTFNEEEKYRTRNITIKQHIYEKILKNLEISKSNDIKIDACDGEAWEFIQYNNNLEVFKRELGYIYNIQPLEEIAKTLLSLTK